VEKRSGELRSNWTVPARSLEPATSEGTVECFYWIPAAWKRCCIPSTDSFGGDRGCRRPLCTVRLNGGSRRISRRLRRWRMGLRQPVWNRSQRRHSERYLSPGLRSASYCWMPIPRRRTWPQRRPNIPSFTLRRMAFLIAMCTSPWPPRKSNSPTDVQMRGKSSAGGLTRRWCF